MKIRKIVHKCNNIILVAKSVYIEKRKNKFRRTRFNKTPDKQKEINRRLAEKKLLMLLQNNFSSGDLHLVLSYDEENYPDSLITARKILENFMRRLRYSYKKAGAELKYIQVTEYENKRLHHHIIVNGLAEIPVSLIQDKIWKNGFVRCTPLEINGYYNELAAYLIKETSKTFSTNEQVFGKRYTSSRNLTLPEPIEEIQQGNESELLEIPLTDTFEDSNYALIKGSEYRGINDYTDLAYIEYAMKEIPYKNNCEGGIRKQSER